MIMASTTSPVKIPKKPQHSDVREYPRKAFHGDVFLKQDGLHPVTAVDLGVGGLAFNTVMPVELEQEVDLVMLNQSVTINGHVRSKVMEQDHWRVGVAFSEPQMDVVDVILSLARS